MKFGGHRHCGSENVMVLDYHLISKNCVMKGLYDFIGGGELIILSIQVSVFLIGVSLLLFCPILMIMPLAENIFPKSRDLDVTTSPAPA